MGMKPRKKPGAVLELWASRNRTDDLAELWESEPWRAVFGGHWLGAGWCGQACGVLGGSLGNLAKPRRVRIHVELLEDDDADAT